MKILKFSAEWCTPCKRLKSVLSEMVLPYPVESVDIDKNPEKAGDYGVRGVPTLILVTDEGTEQGRLVGLKTKADIAEWIS
jgi:thioredoxin 1